MIIVLLVEIGTAEQAVRREKWIINNYLSVMYFVLTVRLLYALRFGDKNKVNKDNKITSSHEK